MCILSNVKLIDHLTFGRESRFLAVISVETALVLVALLPGSVPVITWPFPSEYAAVILLILVFLLVYVLYRLISSAAQATYSPPIQRPIHRVVATVLYVLVGVTGSVTGYLLFVRPYHMESFTAIDIVNGLFWGCLYAVILVGTHGRGMRASVGVKRKSTKIESFLRQVNLFRTDSPGNLDGLADELVQELRDLENEVASEPMSGTESLLNNIRRWLREFESERILENQQRLICAENSSDPHYVELSELFDDITDDLNRLRGE